MFQILLDKPRVYSLTWIREVSGDPNADFLPIDVPVHLAVAQTTDNPHGVGDKLVPRAILHVGGLYLVETADQPDYWFMGDRQGEGPIYCWGDYHDLESAIRGL